MGYMISIDRSSKTSIHDQLVDQLRYLITSGHYKIGMQLPSTRTLAIQLGVSFHTIRKAYLSLEKENLLESKTGRGFTVANRVPLSKSEQMERGAAVIHDMLQHLLGLGLEENEIEYLLEEQLDLLDNSQYSRKLTFVGEYRELAELCAAQISRFLQQPVEAILFQELKLHLDADYIFTAYSALKTVIDEVPRADTYGVYIYYSPDALERVARLLDHQTLGIVVKRQESIPYLMSVIRNLTGFSGQMIASTIEDSPRQLGQILTETDLFLYTPQTRRRLLKYLESSHTNALISPIISPESLGLIRQAIP